jgi:hypothetical protein
VHNLAARQRFGRVQLLISLRPAGCPTLRGFRKVRIDAAGLETRETIPRAKARYFIVTVYAALKRRSSTWIAGNTNNSRSLHSAVAGALVPVGMTGVFALSKTR